MTLDRGALAKIDRLIFSELDHGEGVQLVKVPLSEAVWSTWRRYCQAIGLTMGEGVASLIVHELGTVVGWDGDEGSVFGSEMERRFAVRIEVLDARERRLNDREGLLRVSQQRLRAEERLIRAAPLPFDSASKVGRNEKCPCGSGVKYKYCHGLASR